MDVNINETKMFQKDITGFVGSERELIINKINHYINAYSKNPEIINHKSKKLPFKLTLNDGFTPSLSVLKVGLDFRIIVSFEEDPIFNQLSVYLFRCIRRRDLEAAYAQLARDLYKNNLFIEDEKQSWFK